MAVFTVVGVAMRLLSEDAELASAQLFDRIITASASGSLRLGTHSTRNQINVLFADSHVASIKYLPSSDPQAFTNVTPETTGALSGLIVKWQPRKP